MIVEYDVINCIFCAEDTIAKWEARGSGVEISTVDIHSGDARLKFLKPSRMKGGNVMPMTLHIKKTMTPFGYKYEGRYIIYSVLDSFHKLSFIKRLMNII